MKIIENRQKGTSGFRNTDRDEPLLIFSGAYFRVSLSAQNKLSLKEGDRVIYGVEEDAVLICILPAMSNRKGFKVSHLKKTDLLTISAKSLSHHITKTGIFYVTDEVVSHKDMDWRVVVPYTEPK